jgi:hypothetical protein
MSPFEVQVRLLTVLHRAVGAVQDRFEAMQARFEGVDPEAGLVSESVLMNALFVAAGLTAAGVITAVIIAAARKIHL